MQRGDVWQADIPFTPGHAQAGIRPVAIMQDDSFIVQLPTILVVPFTGSQSATRFPGTLLVQPDGRNGLKTPSVALAFQIRALDKRYFLYPLGVLDSATLDLIYEELDKLTGR